MSDGKKEERLKRSSPVKNIVRKWEDKWKKGEYKPESIRKKGMGEERKEGKEEMMKKTSKKGRKDGSSKKEVDPSSQLVCERNLSMQSTVHQYQNFTPCSCARHKKIFGLNHGENTYCEVEKKETACWDVILN